MLLSPIPKRNNEMKVVMADGFFNAKILKFRELLTFEGTITLRYQIKNKPPRKVASLSLFHLRGLMFHKVKRFADKTKNYRIYTQ